MNNRFLQECLEQAKKSALKGGFPAGAIIAKDKEVVSRGQSLGALLNDPTSHGEIAAIREACSILKTSSLTGCTLYSSMEPCQMCKSAAYWAGIKKIVYIVNKNSVNIDCYETTLPELTQIDGLESKVLDLFK